MVLPAVICFPPWECWKQKAVKFIALEDRPHRMMEGLQVLPDIILDKLSPDEVDLFLIPGVDSDHLQENQHLKEYLLALNTHKKYIAGICSGGDFINSFAGHQLYHCRQI